DVSLIKNTWVFREKLELIFNAYLTYSAYSANKLKF
ncbi:unnamed protein product, partial [marine sediment metagenome]